MKIKINKNTLMITGGVLFVASQAIRVKTELMRMETMESKQEMSDREIAIKCKDYNIEMPPKVEKRIEKYDNKNKKNNNKNKNKKNSNNKNKKNNKK